MITTICLILARAWVSGSLDCGVLVAVAATVGSGVLVAEAVAKPGVVVPDGLLPDGLEGAGFPKICDGSPQLISKTASTINTVKDFRVIPFLLSINDPFTRNDAREHEVFLFSFTCRVPQARICLLGLFLIKSFFFEVVQVKISSHSYRSITGYPTPAAQC
jgi:hypothetical protein